MDRFYRYAAVGILALAIVVFGGIQIAAPSPAPIQTIVQAPATTSEDSVVLINVADGHGSGVHLGGGFIVTAAHVTDGSKPIKLKTSDGKEYEASFLWASKAYDIALIHTDGTIAGRSSLDCRTANVGDEIQASGNPLSLEFVSSFGRVAGNVREMGPWKQVFITDITTVMGVSGGPIFEPDGRVVGIAVGVATAPMKGAIEGTFTPSLTGFGMAVPSSAVCMLLGKGVV